MKWRIEYRFMMFKNCILGQKRNGFFIESGAYTGEYLSNSLYFEIKRNYSGLFDTNWYFTTIQYFLMFQCLSFWYEFLFRILDIKVGSWMKNERVNVGQSQSKVLCLPFYSILLSMGNPTVDYFSLDVERAELPILETIPWDKVNIKVMY